MQKRKWDYRIEGIISSILNKANLINDTIDYNQMVFQLVKQGFIPHEIESFVNSRIKKGEFWLEDNSKFNTRLIWSMERGSQYY